MTFRHKDIFICPMALSMGQAVDVLRAAGEPTRLRILALLAREELAVLELCRVLGQSQPRVSRHVKLLAEARLVERFPDGAWVLPVTSEGQASEWCATCWTAGTSDPAGARLRAVATVELERARSRRTSRQRRALGRDPRV